ncbi:MAG: 30S ribosomal protein S2 [Rickettsiales bacterium]|nr:30S ribosomal protein S2 [Rickettsiales bacterium]
MVDFPKFTMEEMLESGVHFGHKTKMWNPKMAPFIYDSRNGLHVINLQKTVPPLFKSLKIIDSLIQNKQNAQILFVGTKRQASEYIKEFATRCGQFYVNHRWLGGMLTNWSTISKSITTLEDLEKKIKSTEDTDDVRYSKKEILDFTRKRDKLEKVLGGIRKMRGKPDLLFVIDTNKEHIAIKEAQKLGIPIIAIVDTNSDPDGIDYMIPGNDDSRKAIKFYCNLFSDVVLYALGKYLESSGISLEKIKEEEVVQHALNKSTPAKDKTKDTSKEKGTKAKSKSSNSVGEVKTSQKLEKAKDAKKDVVDKEESAKKVTEEVKAAEDKKLISNKKKAETISDDKVTADKQQKKAELK